MQISVTCRHMDVTDSLRDHSIARAEHDLGDFGGQLESVHVILDVQRHNHIAEVVVQGRRHIKVEAREATPDMYHSIDLAFAKASKQIRRLHDKVVEGKRQRDDMAEVERAIGGSTPEAAV